MPLPQPAPGLVTRYAYVWRHEAAQGRVSGAKDRPCVIVLAVRALAGQTIVTVAPITHAEPEVRDSGVRLPSEAQARVGLDTQPAWVIISEVNRFIWPGPDIRPISPDKPDTFAYGFLPEDLLTSIRDRMVAWHRTRRVSVIPRAMDNPGEMT